MLSIEETNAVVRGQFLDHHHKVNFELEEDDDQDNEISKKIWIQCNYVPTEFLGDVTPITISPASTCTLWVNSGSNYIIPADQYAYDTSKISLGDASNVDRFEVEFEIPSYQTTELQWVGFCRSLFPGYREHTPKERQAYSDFIDSFFEEVEL